ncbi:MAG: 6-phosphogluconolactonase [Candidatus Promineifilaceae bacterium]|nr:6-phosphogluconolactonase [Candidatus Promineifilaceae bacterium]
MKCEVRVFSNQSSLVRSAAGLIFQEASTAIADRGRFHFVLSGGSTPAPLYKYLAEPEQQEEISWERTHFYWGDERCVPPDDPGSNYRQAKMLLLDHLPVLPERIHRMKGELSPEEAASEYAAQLSILGEEGRKWPRFDVVLLGMGEDGHTASLFPGSRSDEYENKSVIPVTAHYGDRPSDRISLTPQVFNGARMILFLVVGEGKAQAVEAVIDGPHAPHKWPAQRIKPDDGLIYWLLDEAAANRIS